MSQELRIIIGTAAFALVFGVIALFAVTYVFTDDGTPSGPDQSQFEYGEPAGASLDTLEEAEDGAIPNEIRTDPAALASQGIGDVYDKDAGKRRNTEELTEGTYSATIREPGKPRRRVEVDVNKRPEE